MGGQKLTPQVFRLVQKTMSTIQLTIQKLAGITAEPHRPGVFLFCQMYM